MTFLRLVKAMSGVPGNLQTFFLKRYPSRCRAALSAFSGLVSFPLTAFILRRTVSGTSAKRESRSKALGINARLALAGKFQQSLFDAASRAIKAQPNMGRPDIRWRLPEQFHFGVHAVTIPRLKARKVIRLWFDYYKVARTMPELEENFAASRRVYEPWGNLADYGHDFEIWWNHRGYQLGAVRVREIYGTEIEPDAVDTMRISIPLSLPVSKALAQVKALIEARQSARMSEMGLDPSKAKSLASGFGSYEVTAKELRSQPLREALSLFMVWRDAGQPAINSDFLQSARDWWKATLPKIGLPSFLVVDPQVDKKGSPRFAEEQIRQTRRSIKKAQDVCVAVSEGRFPT